MTRQGSVCGTVFLIIHSRLHFLMLRHDKHESGGRSTIHDGAPRSKRARHSRCYTSVAAILKTVPCPLMDVPIYLAIRDGLEKSSTLEMLHIRCCNTEDSSMSLLVSTLLPFLRVNKTLKSLGVDFRHWNGPQNSQVATSCLATVALLRENYSLETLEICNAGIRADIYIAALESVQMDATLKKLCLSPILDLFGDGEMKRVVSLVKKNYSLAVLDEGVSTHDKTGELHAVLRLNQAGRGYLIDDAGSIAKGVEVLIDVRDDLACLFYHLLENPMLCDIEHQYEQPGVPTARGGTSSHGTKRVRLTH
jgi:hypothetical protein